MDNRVAKNLFDRISRKLSRISRILVPAGGGGDNAAEIERRYFTYQVIGSDDDAAKEQNGRCDPVMHSEDHVVDNSLVDQISHLDEAGNRRD